MIQLYLDDSGDIVTDEKSVLSNENIDLVEKLIRDQKDVQKAEVQEEKFRTGIVRAKNLGDID
jgi:hypothetical protein